MWVSPKGWIQNKDFRKCKSGRLAGFKAMILKKINFMTMKKIFLSLVLGLLSINTFAQNNESTPLLSVSFEPNLGNGQVNSSDFENQNGLFNGGNLLLNYHMSLISWRCLMVN